MSEEFPLLYDMCEEDEAPDDLAPIIARLQSDGEVWRRQVPSAQGLDRFVTALQVAGIEKSAHNETTNLARFLEFDDQKIAPASQSKSMHPHKPASHRSARLRSLLAPVAALVLVLFSAVIFSNHRTPAPDANSSDRQSSLLTPIPATNPLGIMFQQFSIVGAGDIWAAGFISAGTHEAMRGVIAHYTKSTWTLADDTSFPGVQLTQIQMLSDTDGWVAGTSHANASVLYHLAGGHWVQVPLPEGLSQKLLATLQITGADDVWVLVEFVPPGAVTGKSILLHYEEGTWRNIPVQVDFWDFLMVDDHEGWFQQNSGIWHFVDGHFTPSNTVADDGNYVTLSDASASTGTWGIRGYDPNFNHPQSSVLKARSTDLVHFDGTSWTTIGEPMNLLPAPDYYILRFYARTAQDGWAQLEEIPTEAIVVNPRAELRYMLRFENGVWSLVPTPMGINIQTVWMTSASDGWAVGLSADYLQRFSTYLQQRSSEGAKSGSNLPLPDVLRYQNGMWSVASG